MTLLDKVNKKIKEIENDSRHKAEPALVEINAPLALIQILMDGQMDILRWVRDELMKEKKKNESTHPKLSCPKCFNEVNRTHLETDLRFWPDCNDCGAELEEG